MLAAIPNALIRSNLFTVKKLNSNRKPVKRIIECQKNYEIQAEGRELSQYDSIICYTCLYIMQNRRLSCGDKIDTSMSEICEILEVDKSGREFNKIWDSIERIKENYLIIKTGGNQYNGTLIRTATKTRRGFTFEFNNQFMQLLTGTDRTLTDVKCKASITGELAKWLYDYFNSHSTANTNLSTRYLQRLCGSSSNQNEFRRILRKSMEKLYEASHPKIHSFEITRNNIILNNSFECLDKDNKNPFE